MKKVSTIYLQAVIMLIGIIALFIMIRLPLTEGRAVNLDLISIYSDPFIVYGYIASSAFFAALYQAFKLIGYIRQNKVFSDNSVKALRTIKYCAITLSILIVLAAVYIRIFHAKDDDPAGFIALCIIATFASVIIATTVGLFESILQSAMDKLNKT